MDLVDLLWADFGYWRSHTQNYAKIQREHRYLRPLKFDPKRRALFAQVIAWCRTRQLPPRQWLYSLFAIRRWMFAPKLETACLCSERHIPKFLAFADYPFYFRRMRELENLAPLDDPNTFDPNRDLSNTAELAKRYYRDAGLIQECIDRMRTETFGYHPGSSICVACVGGRACASQLMEICNFDVLGLRLMNVTNEQARAQAFARSVPLGRWPLSRMPG